MANEIVIKVVLDTGDLKKGTREIEKQLKDATTQATGTAKTGGKRVGDAFSEGLKSQLTSQLASLKNLIGGPLGIGAAVAGLSAGLFSFAKDAAAAGARIDDFRQKTNLSIEAISALDVALKLEIGRAHV